MKYIVLVPDGLADYPIDELDGRTPLEAARTPNMDFIAKNGQVGRCLTIPDTLSPGSDVANLSLFGYDPLKYYSGRAPLEAANLKVDIKNDEIAFRCNLVTISEDKMEDYSAGHITTKEAKTLIEYLDKKLSTSEIRFYPGVSYRHLMVIKQSAEADLEHIKCIPPHDILGKKIDEFMPKHKKEKENILITLMNESKKVLASHEINNVRVDLGENPANMIWLWGQGRQLKLPLFKEMFGIDGCVISAVDLIKGIALLIGLNPINVPGATGYYDTNYSGKAQHAIDCLENHDFVYVHVEATDEAGHNGDIRAKVGCTERFDELIVGKILKAFANRDDYRILVVPDHATPLSLRTHTRDVVCFTMLGKGINPDSAQVFSEKEAAKSSLYFEQGYKLMEHLIKS